MASIYTEIPAFRAGTIGGYAFGVACALVALVLRIGFEGYMVGAHYLTFFPAVSIATLMGGVGSGIVCTICSVAAVFLFIVPLTVILNARPAEVTSLVLFIPFAFLNVFVASVARLAIEDYRDLSRNLERRVEARTAEVARRSRELDETNGRLREANEISTAIYERGGIVVGHLDTEGRVVDANPACVEGLGFARTDIIGKPFWQTGWWRTLPECRESIRERVELAHAGEGTRGESRYVTGNGEERVTDMTMTPIKASDGRIVSIFVVSLDVTERARRYQAIFENATVGIVHATSDLKWGRVNDAMARIAGYPATELVNKPVLDIVHPDHREAALADIARLRNREADSFVSERRYVRSDGDTVWVRAAVGAQRNVDGSIASYVGVIQDVSGRKRAEELLRRQADLLEQSHDAVFTRKIGDGGIAYWNRGAEVLYGYSREEAIGRSPRELLRTRSSVSPQDIEAEIARRGSWEGELTHTARDGRQISVLSRQVRVSYDDQVFALETNRDITERKRAEDALRSSEERFRSSIVQSPVPTILYDDREQILAVSRSWLEAAGGISADELQRLEDWTRIAYGERSGEILELGRLEILAAEPEMRVHELTVHTRSGAKRLWNFVSSSLGTKSDGRHLFVSVAQDVTDQRAYEERIDLLMREARHRTKNILGLVQVIARQTATTDDRDFLGRFSDRVLALAENQDLLGRHEWQRIGVRDLVQGQLGHFADLIGTRVKAEGPQLHLNASAAQAIGLALHELATNASKYGALSNETGRVEVSWQLAGDNYLMVWEEHDGPRVSPPKGRGFGTTVTQSMLQRALAGEVELDYATSGLRWGLTCPKANALEPAG